MGTLRFDLSECELQEIKMAPSNHEFCRFGDFSYRFTKEAADFYTSVGYPRDIADKMVGVKMWMKNVDMSRDKDGKEGKHRVCSHFNLEGFPEYSSCYVATEGEKNMINFPLMGGRAVFTFKKTDKGYESICESKMMGKWETKMEFNDEGINCLVRKDGKTFNEQWKRIMHVDGLYKMSKQDKVEQSMKKLGYPDFFVSGMDRYKFAFKTWDSGMKMTEWWGEFNYSYQCKFDEEAEFKFPMEKGEFPQEMYIPPAKYVFSKTGNGKYTMIFRDKEGRSTEWKFYFNGDKCEIHGRNENTNDTCYMECKKEYLPIIGNWRTASISGAKELMSTMGFPKEQYQQWLSDRPELFIEEKGLITHWTWKSKFFPMDMSFEYDREFEVFDPCLQEKVRCVASKYNNKMKFLTHSSHGCWETKIAAGNDFLVFKTWLQGLDCMPMTYMFTRQSYRMPLNWNNSNFGNQQQQGFQHGQQQQQGFQQQGNQYEYEDEYEYE